MQTDATTTPRHTPSNTGDSAFDLYADQVFDLVFQKYGVDDMSPKEEGIFTAALKNAYDAMQDPNDGMEYAYAELWDYGPPVERALILALRYHKKQRDKCHKSYFGHLIRVAGRFTEEKLMVISLLHDIIEDTGCTLSTVRYEFGDEIADAVDALSRRTDETYKIYMRRVRANKLAKRVKYKDLRDNLRRDRGFISPEMEKARKQYWMGLSILDQKGA